MKKLSELAWHKSQDVVRAIKNHPFNIEMATGDLAIDKFAYYIEQDTLYLRDFARSLAMIASRAPLEYMRECLSFADNALIAEQEVVHSFFRKTFNSEILQIMKGLTPATLSYTSYLLQVCSREPLEIAIAAVLPCFWVYREIGLLIASKTKAQNPYSRWIDTYSGEEFAQGTKKAIDIFDQVALKASAEIQDQMIDAFYKSTVLEWHFWNDAYNKTTFDDFLNN